MAYNPGTKKALVHLTKYRKFRTCCHTFALIVETIGTVLIFLDTVRMDVQLHAAGYVSYTGEAPLPYQHWYYHHAPIGFALLFFGILAQGFLVWFEHHELQKAAEAIHT
jgi:hypothetical protein